MLSRFTNRFRVALIAICIGVVGCDSNPGGPTAPSVSSSKEDAPEFKPVGKVKSGRQTFQGARPATPD